MAPPVSSKGALVTGGARGIGRAIAASLSSNYAVAITYLTTAPDDLPEGMLAIRADLADPQSHKRVIDAVLAQFGRLDLIVNNAGTIAGSPVDSFDQDAFRGIFDVNVLASHGLVAAALPYLGHGCEYTARASGCSIDASIHRYDRIRPVGRAV